MFMRIRITMYKTVMGIDQSLTCAGIVILLEDNVVHFETIKTKKEDGDVFERCLIIVRRINELIKQHNIDTVNLEGLSFVSRGNATRDLACLQGSIVVSILDKFKIKCNIVAPTKVKYKAAGNGKASKGDMINSLPSDIIDRFKKTGYKKTTGLADLADAYWIAQLQ